MLQMILRFPLSTDTWRTVGSTLIPDRRFLAAKLCAGDNSLTGNEKNSCLIIRAPIGHLNYLDTKRKNTSNIFGLLNIFVQVKI